MTKQTINNGDSALLARTKLNANFTELYDSNGGGSWGSITGTLSAQTDLQTALDAKAPSVSPTFTAAWKLQFGYFASALRPFMSSEGYPGAGWYNYNGDFVGGIVAPNGGGFALEFTGGSRVVLSAAAQFERYVATDANGGGTFNPLFTLDATSGHEGGFYRSGTKQVWGADRSSKVTLDRDGTLELVSGKLVLTSLPTSATGLASGTVWKNGTSLAIV